MIRRTRTSLSWLFAAILAASGGVANAQFEGDYPNLDMSWGVQQQLYMQQYGEWSASHAASLYLDYAAKLRAQGYTGEIAIPFNAGTISKSISEGNEAFDSGLHSHQQNMNNLYGTIERYSQEGILGQSGYSNPATGQGYTLPNTYNYNWVSPNGDVYGTNTYTPPSYDLDWTQLVPNR